CYSVIDHNDRTVFHGNGRRHPVSPPAALDFGQFQRYFAVDVSLTGTDRPGHVVVYHNLFRASVHHCTDAKLPVPRRTDLAHHQQVQWGVKPERDFESDRHTAARESQYDRIREINLCKSQSKLPPGLSPVGEWGRMAFHFHSPKFRVNQAIASSTTWSSAPASSKR